MTRLEALRISAGLSKSKLARMAELSPALVTYAEQRGFRLYPVQLARLAKAIGWPSDPEALLDEVGTDA